MTEPPGTAVLSLRRRRETARRVLADPDRKPVGRMLVELVVLTVRQRELPRHYVGSLMYRADSGPILAYATPREIDRINRAVLLPRRKPTLLLQDKVWFDRWLEHHGLPRVPVLAVVDQGVLTRRGQQPVSGPAVREVLQVLQSEAPRGALFVKPVQGIQGRDARRLEDAASIDAWLADGVGVPMLVQHAVEQHPVLDAVYPGALNTVRVQTCRLSDAPDGPVVAATGVLRVGARGSVVDNASQGGLSAALDLETGRLTAPFLAAAKHGGRGFVAHPDSGVGVDAIVVPEVAHVVELVVRAHRWLPNRLVAWDVAITTQGPAILEANDVPPLNGVQAAAGGLWASPVYRQVLGPHVGRGASRTIAQRARHREELAVSGVPAAQLASLLQRRALHGPLDLPLRGRSMGRWWRHADRVKVAPGGVPQRGQVWVFVSSAGQIVAHRCRRAPVGGAAAVFRGDGNMHADGPVDAGMLVGRVTAVQRRGRWQSLGLRAWLHGALARAATLLRRVIGGARRHRGSGVSA